MRWPKQFQEEEPMAKKAKGKKRAKRSKTKAELKALRAKTKAAKKTPRQKAFPGMLKVHKDVDRRAEKNDEAKQRREDAGQQVRITHDLLMASMKHRGLTKYRTASGLDCELTDRFEHVTVTRSKRSDD